VLIGELPEEPIVPSQFSGPAPLGGEFETADGEHRSADAEGPTAAGAAEAPGDPLGDTSSTQREPEHGPELVLAGGRGRRR
jgi:hypothetical protein